MSRRDELIDAATRSLSRKGYRGASIKEIAAEAGVAPGLLHYYFANKEELLVAVLFRMSERHKAELHGVVDSLGPDEMAGESFAAQRERVESEPEWYRMRFDLFALALHNEALSAAVADLLRAGRTGIAEIMRAIARRPDLDAEPAASILLACFDGLALQRLVDQDFDLERAYETLAEMVAAYRAAQRAKGD